MTLSRRTLLTGSGALLATIAPGVRCGFAAVPGRRDILISLFLRFGADGLSLIPPADDGNYHDARPTLGVSANAALPLGSLGGVPFFFHPEAAPLKALYDANQLAVIHAAGMFAENRSHFVSQDMIDRGVADGDAAVNAGWIARHLLSSGVALPPLGAVASAANLDLSMQGFPGSVAVPDVNNFNVFGGDANLNVIARMQAGDEPHVIAARAAIGTIRSVQAGVASLSPDLASNAPYTTGPLSASLRSVATLIKMNVGLDVAAVDYYGWDHHVNLNLMFPPQARELSQSLAAFWQDVAAYRDRITLVTMTEFGRRVGENSNAGTDHGSAAFMLVLGGAVNGGRLYGDWPGLGPAQLHDGDVTVTTDYRTVLSEILVKRRGETSLARVFPRVSYKPLGVLNAGP